MVVSLEYEVDAHVHEKVGELSSGLATLHTRAETVFVRGYYDPWNTYRSGVVDLCRNPLLSRGPIAIHHHGPGRVPQPYGRVYHDEAGERRYSRVVEVVLETVRPGVRP